MEHPLSATTAPIDADGSKRPNPGRALALAGGAWGAACALALGGMRFFLSEPPLRQAEAVGDFAFLAVYLVPFMVALRARGWPDAGRRVMVWTAGTIVASLAGFSAFSGVSLIFLLAVPLLALAVLRALTQADWRRGLAGLGLGVALAAVTVGAFAALFLLFPEAGRCWNHVVTAEGRAVWQEVPFSHSISLPPTAEGPVKSFCTTDILSPLEGLTSLALLTLGWVGLPRLLKDGGNKASLSDPPPHVHPAQ